MEESDRKEAAKFFHRLRKEASTKSCLWDEGCDGPIVKAHAIQENGILSKISEEGHVSILWRELTSSSKDPFELLTEGKGKFSTFPGFCKYHDTVLFSEIENEQFSPTESKYARHSLRAVAKGLHEKNAICSLYKKMLTAGISNNEAWKSKIQKTILEKEADRKDLEKVFLQFKYRISAGKYGFLKTILVTLDREYPIAATACFTPEFDPLAPDSPGYKNQLVGPLKKRKPFVFLSVFPQDGKTYAIISTLKQDYPRMGFLAKLREVRSLHEKKVILSRIVLQMCDCVAFSPKYIRDKFSAEDRRSLIEHYRHNMYDPSKGLREVIGLFR